MPFSTIVFETLDGVARITLNRPERANALNQAMLEEIGQALDEAESAADVRAIIVRGVGAAFSSGFDLKEQMERRPTGVEQWRPILRKDFDTVMRFWHCPKPTIAAVRGPCLAGFFSYSDRNLERQAKKSNRVANTVQPRLNAPHSITMEEQVIAMSHERAGLPSMGLQISSVIW